MKKFAAMITLVAASMTLSALAYADSAPTSNKWRIELDGKSAKGGDMEFRVTPSQGDPVDVVATIHSGRGENDVAKEVRDAFAAKLSPERYTVEVDDGEDILIKKKEGQPDFALELVESSVQNVSVKIQGE